MSDQVNLERAARQLLEMEEFFAGDFTRRSAQEIVIPEAVAQSDAAAGLKAIADEAAKCCKCDLNRTRLNVVPGEGNPHARIVFVGEAPGADEDKAGRPFVGGSGKLLEKIINAMGLERSEVFICNILKCRPPDNRNPKAGEIQECRAYLNRQIELIAPEVIIALGAQATKALLGSKTAIGDMRGKFHDYYTSDNAEPIKLMPTYHPAYLKRNYTRDTRMRVWDDMKKVLIELDMPVPESKKQ